MTASTPASGAAPLGAAGDLRLLAGATVPMHLLASLHGELADVVTTDEATRRQSILSAAH